MARVSAKWSKLDNISIVSTANGEFTVKVDDLSIEKNTSNGIQIKNLGVKLNHLDLGFGPTQISSLNIPVQDTNNLFSEDYINNCLTQLASKMILYKHTNSSFDNINPTVPDALDSIIKSIPNHNNGQGSSTTVGVVINSTKNYQIPIRDHVTKNPINDGHDNDVYARLTFDTVDNKYKLYYYSLINNTETAYTGFTSSNKIDIAYILFSQYFINIPWNDVFVSGEFQDLIIPTTSLMDDNIQVDGMLYLLAGLVTQAQVNSKVDLLGKVDAATGAKLIAVSSVLTSSTNVLDCLNEIYTNIGNRTYTNHFVVANGDTITHSIDKLDTKFFDLDSTAVSKGGHLVGFNNQGKLTSTRVDDAILEVNSKANITNYEYTITSNDVTNGYFQLSSLVKGTVSNNVVTPSSLFCMDVIHGIDTRLNEYAIMRSDNGATDYIVFKPNINISGVTNASPSSIVTTDFGDVLSANDIIKLRYVYVV
jgi:hypothetical protein